jgi:hypothetical protein
VQASISQRRSFRREDTGWHVSCFHSEVAPPVLMETQRGELQFVFVGAGSSLPRIEADMDKRLAHGHDRA